MSSKQSSSVVIFRRFIYSRLGEALGRGMSVGAMVGGLGAVGGWVLVGGVWVA